jgi:hypothetical protein
MPLLQEAQEPPLTIQVQAGDRIVNVPIVRRSGGPDYVKAFGGQLVAGRDLRASDSEDVAHEILVGASASGRPVAIVDQTLAARGFSLAG